MNTTNKGIRITANPIIDIPIFLFSYASDCADRINVVQRLRLADCGEYSPWRLTVVSNWHRFPRNFFHIFPERL